MRSFKDVADRHIVSLDNRQLALLTSGAVVAAGMFFLTGVLYGTRVSLPTPGSLALRLPESAEAGSDMAAAVLDEATRPVAPAGATVVPVGKSASTERDRLREQFARESVRPEPAIAEVALPRESPGAASQPSRPMAQLPPPSDAKRSAVQKTSPAVKPAEPKPEAKAAAKPAPEKTVAVAAPQKSSGEPQPLLRGRKLSTMKGPLTVQVAAFTDKATAQKELERWERGRFPAFIGTDRVNGKNLYRIQIGRFSDRKEAETAAQALKRDLKVKGPMIMDAVK